MTKRVVTIGAGGGTFSFDPAAGFQEMVVGCAGGAVALTSSVTINHASTPVGASVFVVHWTGGFTKDGNTITVFNRQLSNSEALKPSTIYGLFNPWTNSFNVVVSSDDGTSEDVTVLDLSANMSGGSVNVSPRLQTKKIVLTGSGTLTGNLSINLITTNLINGDDVEIYYAANINIAAFTLNVASFNIHSSSAVKQDWMIRGVFKSTWYVRSVNLAITTDKAAVYVQKTYGGGAFEALRFSEDNDHAVGYDSVANEVKSDFSAIRRFQRELSEAEVSAIVGGAEIVIIEKHPDSAKCIDIVGRVFVEVKDLVGPYTSVGNAFLVVKYNGATDFFMADSASLKSTVERKLDMISTATLSVSTATKILKNADFVVTTSGSYSGGQMKIIVSGYYRYS